MAGFSTTNNEHLIRANLWSTDLLEMFEDELMGQRYVDWLTGFTDGDTYNIPSIGQMETQDYAEGQALRFTGMDTGNFTFSITSYKSSGTYITNKMKQDSMWTNRLVSTFVPKMHRAIAKTMEIDLLATGAAGQTATSLNAINGAAHRFVASGTGQVLMPKDFARAKYGLAMANVPSQNLIALVHPSVAYNLETMTNIVNVSNNPQWQGVITTGLSTGMRFIRNVFGFDVYECQNLPVIGAETIDSVAVNSTGVANYFFSATPDALPWVGSVRQPPKVDSKYNMDLQREEYAVTVRYGFKLFRPDNFVTVLSATDQVA